MAPHSPSSPLRRAALAAPLALLLGGALVQAEAGAQAPIRVWETGTELIAPPAGLPGQPIPPGTDPIDLAALRNHLGNQRGAITLLEDWLDGKLPELQARDQRTRWVGARFMLGLLYLDEGHHNQASAQFTRVRMAKGALEEEAAWLEALMDFRRGRHRVAAQECAAYRRKYSRGRHEEDCLLLEGDGWTAGGAYQPAIDAYDAFIAKDRDGPDVEIAELGKALAQTNRSKSKAVPLLRDAALDYAYPTSRDIALAALEELSTEGLDTSLPDSSEARIRRLMSTYASREYELAHQLWAELEQDESPGIQAWLKKNREGFGWSTRSYAMLVELYEERLAANDDPETCWLAHRAAMRGGLWGKAAEWAEHGRRNHTDHWRWRGAKDDLALASLLAGEHARALELWDELGQGGGARGRKARWYAAFTTWRAGDLDEAQQRLETIRGGDSARTSQAQYYLARVAEAKGETEEAKRIYADLLSRDPHDWYGLLAYLRTQPPLEGDPWLVRDGDWPSPVTPSSQAPEAMPVRAPPDRIQAPPAAERSLPERRTVSWATLRWGDHAPPPGAATPPQPSPRLDPASRHLLGQRGEAPPLSVIQGRYYDEDQAREAFARFATRYGSLWPELHAIRQLAEVGAYDLAGELMARVYDELEQGRRGRGPKRGRVSGITGDLGDWRELALYTRAWHLMARFSGKLHEHTEDPEEKRQALGMEYPAAFPQHVWPSAREHDVDPLLMLAVMRTESYYKSWAVSSADAQGLMQILPVTGARVAHDQGRSRYSPRELMDPATNIDFGAWYLHQLIDRFDGCVPLAVAAYNAGPVAVSDWLEASGEDMPLDDFVELIPIDQPHNYVRRVLGRYSMYTSVHGPHGARVALSMKLGSDDPSVIDY
jgi:tetratricopeptide (TPR) repeat protein